VLAIRRCQNFDGHDLPHPPRWSLLAGDDELKRSGVRWQCPTVSAISENHRPAGECRIELSESEDDTVTIGPGDNHVSRQVRPAKSLASRDSGLRQQFSQ
jgi:hypothetical protein